MRKYTSSVNVTAAIPRSTLDASLDLATGKMTGQVQVPDFPVTIRLLNAVPVTAVTRLVPVGQLTGTLNGTLTTTTSFTLRLVRVYQPTLPLLNLVPSTCRTASATTGRAPRAAPESGWRSPSARWCCTAARWSRRTCAATEAAWRCE